MPNHIQYTILLPCCAAFLHGEEKEATKGCSVIMVIPYVPINLYGHHISHLQLQHYPIGPTVFTLFRMMETITSHYNGIVIQEQSWFLSSRRFRFIHRMACEYEEIHSFLGCCEVTYGREFTFWVNCDVREALLWGVYFTLDTVPVKGL